MLLTLGIIPVLIVIHILKPKPRQVEVTNLFLWNEILKERSHNLSFERFKKNLPLILQILIVILAALSLGGFAGKLVESGLGENAQARLVSMVAKYAIVFLGISMGLDQLGVAKDIIHVAVSAVLGAVALALGLAFGLGGRDRAKEILERQVSSDD